MASTSCRTTSPWSEWARKTITLSSGADSQNSELTGLREFAKKALTN